MTHVDIHESILGLSALSDRMHHGGATEVNLKDNVPYLLVPAVVNHATSRS